MRADIVIPHLDSLPSLPWRLRGHLPPSAGVYFVLHGHGDILSIGRSTSLLFRCRHHHRHALFAAISGLRIAWMACANVRTLHTLEAYLMKYFVPPLNQAPVV